MTHYCRRERPGRRANPEPPATIREIDIESMPVGLTHNSFAVWHTVKRAMAQPPKVLINDL
jgi:hypothetical protein